MKKRDITKQRHSNERSECFYESVDIICNRRCIGDTSNGCKIVYSVHKMDDHDMQEL